MKELVTHSHVQEISLMPKTPDIYRRDQRISSDIPYFSTGVKNIAIVPLRAEFDNNHLAEYLTVINHQQGQSGQKIGVVFLVNDHAGDKNNDRVLRENSLSTDYLSFLARKELPPDELAIPQSYQEIAEKIIGNDNIEIRVDYVHSQLDYPHYGIMPLHLLNLAGALKNPETPPEDTIIHLHDIDMRLRRTHFANLTRSYQVNPNMRVNISEFDLSPGIHEDIIDEDEDISQELLLQLDNYRFFQYAQRVRTFILGVFYSGTPTLSGRYSYFFPHGQLNRLIAYTLEQKPTFNDFNMANIMKKSNEHIDGGVGYNEEVFYLHRARTSDVSVDEAPSESDGETIYVIVKEKAFKGEGFKRKYNLIDEGDKFLEDLEEQVAKTNNSKAIQTGHTPDFLKKSTYQHILDAEVKAEQAKIMRRRERLLNFIQCNQASSTPLDQEVMSIIDPFIQKFPDEVGFINEHIAKGRKPDQIAEDLIQKYDSFFNPDAKIHTQIARVRALKKYVFIQNISLVEDSREHS